MHEHDARSMPSISSGSTPSCRARATNPSRPAGGVSSKNWRASSAGGRDCESKNAVDTLEHRENLTGALIEEVHQRATSHPFVTPRYYSFYSPSKATDCRAHSRQHSRLSRPARRARLTYWHLGLRVKAEHFAQCSKCVNQLGTAPHIDTNRKKA
jgi:hypothetical protein